MSDKKIAIIGGGPAGLSVAWQLRRQGHETTIYDLSATLGGKIRSVIPSSRIPKEISEIELERIKTLIAHVHLQQPLTPDEVIQMENDFNFIVIATGAQAPRILPVPGKEHMIPANDFLAMAKADKVRPGRKVVIVGGGNVGCDVATEVHRLGARDITLIDVQKPLSFGQERDAAEEVGAKFLWPCFTQEITPTCVKLTDGRELSADMVIISIGDVPDLSFLPDNVATERGYIVVNDDFQTTDSQIFAIGDVVRPGLLTDAIGAGRRASDAIIEILAGRRPLADNRRMIDRKRITLEYFDPRITEFSDMDHCGDQCSSCGSCRDCRICVNLCPQAAIRRQELPDDDYEYVVKEDLCIGCGLCSAVCPCGIWDLVENTPMD